MKFLPLFHLAIGLAFSTFTNPTFATDLNQLTPEEQAAGWSLLFDGKTLQGWHPLKKLHLPTEGWKVQDGTIFHGKSAGGGDILTTNLYTDFEVVWEWKIGQAGNSGLKYNLPDPDDNLGFEYQLIDDQHHPDGLRGGRSHQTAALYDLLEPSEDRRVQPAGEWNQSRLLVRGNHVEHWLNGTKVVEFTMSSDEMKAKIAKSKYKKFNRFGVKTASPILLQDHGDEVAFRNLKVRQLATP